MIDSGALLRDLRGQLKLLEQDLRARAEDPDVKWSTDLRGQYDGAFAAGRTGMAWTDWRDGEIAQAAVAWLVAATFVRFCEDNGLLAGATTTDGIPAPWIAGPTDHADGDRVARAREHQDGYFLDHLTANDRHWWHQAFGVLADLPVGKGLVDRAHNPVWTAHISAEAARALLDFFRATDESGGLVHDFTDLDLDTRFLGDLYQDLSEHAKKTFALLQTPEFVEEFILDRTLEPAVQEFGLTDLKLIDPTCGSGHFLLGAFQRLLQHWTAEAPALDARERVQRALDSVHGVDLNPFAVAIARFRLTVAALKASGEPSLTSAPAYRYHLAIGDSLLGEQGTQGDLLSDDQPFAYATEDLADHLAILQPGRYHVVVGNPPYITPKDKALNEAYRLAYPTCHRQYALSVPFMELFFRLARRQTDNSGAGYVGKITSNSFMKREFGRKLVEDLLVGTDSSNPADLTAVIDTAGASIPGHKTPTAILFGRRRRPSAETVKAVLGIRGEAGQPVDVAAGAVWQEISKHADDEYYQGDFVTVTKIERSVLARHPWSLSGGGASEVLQVIASSGQVLADFDVEIGRTTHTGLDEAFYRDRRFGGRFDIPEVIPVVLGDELRDFTLTSETATLFPYDEQGTPIDPGGRFLRSMWPMRTALRQRIDFGRGPEDRGLRWFDHSMFFADRYRRQRSIAFAFVAPHNHFILDRGGKVFKQTAPAIKLSINAGLDKYLGLYAALNSSVSCFWLHSKCLGKPLRGEEWQRRYEYDGAKLRQIGLPSRLPIDRGRRLDQLSQELGRHVPSEIIGSLTERPTRGNFDTVGHGAIEDALESARRLWQAVRLQLIFEQEELDWQIYRLFGLVDSDLTYSGAHATLSLGERAFEIVLARQIAEGAEESAWFERHGSTPITDLPADWPEDYQAVVRRRLEEIESNPHIRLLERPEYKRRWATRGWEAMEKDAVTAAVLDRLEAPELWRDASGPTTRSVAELADLLRGDEVLGDLLARLAGSSDVDRVPALERLIAEEAVPYLAALRYKPSGVEKFRQWQHVWELQREEDRIDAGGAGEKPTIPVPPKYGQADFRKPAYWKARGKLDVPKERFIVYPWVTRSGEASTVLGWAGWDHAEQALALARLLTDLGQVDTTIAKPLLAGLVELEPWVHQWHSEIDPTFSASPADVVTGFLDGQLAEHELTRDSATSWTPPAPTRGRPRKDSTA